MTKAELIRFLEPFDDDIKIVITVHEHGWTPLSRIEAVYNVAANKIQTPSVFIDKGEGFILIR